MNTTKARVSQLQPLLLPSSSLIGAVVASVSGQKRPEHRITGQRWESDEIREFHGEFPKGKNKNYSNVRKQVSGKGKKNKTKNKKHKSRQP